MIRGVGRGFGIRIVIGQQLHKHLDISQDKQLAATVTGSRGEQVVGLYGLYADPLLRSPSIMVSRSHIAHSSENWKTGKQRSAKGLHLWHRSDLRQAQVLSR